MNDILITIGIPTYNRCHSLVKLISDLSPYLQDSIEVIVSDNCSTDSTEYECQKMLSYIDFCYHRQEKNLGPDLNFLWILKHARGKYVWLISDDDLIDFSYFQAMLNDLQNKEIGLGYINCMLINDNKKQKRTILKKSSGLQTTYDKNLFLSIVSFNLTFLSSIIFRKELVQKILNPERFDKSNFLQTFIAFESTHNNKCEYAVFYSPIIVVHSNDCVNYSMYEVFGYSLRNLCRYLYLQLGFDKRVVNTCYKKYLKQVVFPGIVHAKHYGYKNMLTRPMKMVKATTFSGTLLFLTCIIVFTPSIIVKFLLKRR